MANILDAYREDLEKSGEHINNDLPENSLQGDNFDMEAYVSRLKEMREQIDEYDKHGTIEGKAVSIEESEESAKNDPYGEYIKDGDEEFLNIFRNEYKDFPETELKTVKEELKPVVIRAYCPECGEEIVSTAPVMFNPFTLEKICKYDCKCGWKANLEFAYPRVVFVTESGDEIQAYAK